MTIKTRITRSRVVAVCIGCGCDDFHACWDDTNESPCFWERVDCGAGLGVCSACPECVGAWDAGDRAVRVPVDDRAAGGGPAMRERPIHDAVRDHANGAPRSPSSGDHRRFLSHSEKP
ncbi:hypothetical protein [Burkholderia ubonensis]|uniref:hypothetical protein n=1 Tax=Burkholderia ubonensis TaxID=101571 RepID=UPI000B1ACCDE|nr:hypothetical protein [Burkholderia ubonensis]